MVIITQDPGHGGKKSPGAIGPTGVQEKVVALAVALRVREILRGRATVHMTRTTDVDVPLARRLAAPGAACFVSIHCNAHTTRTANGTETFRFVGGHQRSVALAGALQRHLVAGLGLRDRGVKTASFQVLRQAIVPAVLVELGFISNHTEEALLESEQGQERAAQAIVAGLTEFLGVQLKEVPIPIRPIVRPVRTHQVVAGETLWGIARQHNVSVSQLQRWNRLATDVVHVGQRLVVEKN